MKKSAKPGVIKSCVQALARWADLPVGVGNGFDYNRDNPLNLDCTADAVMRLSAAWACVTLLSDTIATLPLSLYRRTATGREVATDHPLYRVVHRQANAEMTSAQWIGAITAQMLLWGECYSEKLISGGQVIGARPLRPDWVNRYRLANGRWEYRFTTKNGRSRTLSDAQLMRIPAFSTDGECALSPIRYGAQVFSAAYSAQQAANSTFSNGLHPTIAFKYPQVLQRHQREEARETINQLSGAVNAGSAVILEAGMDAMPLGINPADAQLLESRAFSVEEICSWFRVQPFMIGRASQGQTNWGTGIEQQMIGFITFTLRPWLARIEQAISKDMLRPEERETYYVEFNLEGLLRGDSAARAAFYSSAVQNGWMNRTTVAARENLPEPTGGDLFTIQANLVETDKVGKTSAVTINNNSPVDAGAEVQQSALNGAQVMALQAIVAAVATGAMPSDTAAAMIQSAFPLLTETQINDMLDPLKNFQPKEPPNAP